METILTSVRLIKTVYEEFKIDSIKTGMTLQKLVNTTLLQFTEDSDFRKDMLTYASGSSI